MYENAEWKDIIMVRCVGLPKIPEGIDKAFMAAFPAQHIPILEK
jgi:hypothetical protein